VAEAAQQPLINLLARKNSVAQGRKRSVRKEAPSVKDHRREKQQARSPNSQRRPQEKPKPRN